MKPIIILSLLTVFMLTSGCAPGTNIDARLRPIVEPYRFSIAGWEFRTLTRQTGQWLTAKPETPRDDDAEVGLVTEYFSEATRPTTLAPAVERIIQKQIREVLSELGIYNPIIDKKFGFPPLSFKLEELPAVLVISPRERIESMREIVLQQNLTLEQREALEASADKLGVSSLVVRIGGMATYPTLIDSKTSLRSAIDTAVHEWLHQYLAFTPLGFRYVLDVTGISRSYDIATINESLAGMVSKEIGAKVYEKYYSRLENDAAAAGDTDSEFNTEMREIRKTVDVYLAQGEIARAEAYMEQRRQELDRKGYRIRKLNQAYFAFHGTYADTPAFLSPIGQELKELRSRSTSLKGFLDTASRMTTRQDLTESVR